MVPEAFQKKLEPMVSILKVLGMIHFSESYPGLLEYMYWCVVHGASTCRHFIVVNCTILCVQ